MDVNSQIYARPTTSNIHLFTSFVTYDDCPNSVKDFYTKKLIPQWVKIHLKFFDSVNVITNIPDRFEGIDFLNVHSITLKEAFCNYDYKNLNVTASQLGSWISFIKLIPEGDIAIYLDPDAFMLTNKLKITASKTKSCELTRIVSPGRMCDAGVAILRNNYNTRKILLDMTEILSNTRIVNHIEVCYQNKFKENKDYFIKWSRHSLLLREEICGILSSPDTVHDSLKLEKYNVSLDDNCRNMLDLIKEKKEHRINYLPN